MTYDPLMDTHSRLIDVEHWLKVAKKCRREADKNPDDPVATGHLTTAVNDVEYAAKMCAKAARLAHKRAQKSQE